MPVMQMRQGGIVGLGHALEHPEAAESFVFAVLKNLNLLYRVKYNY